MDQKKRTTILALLTGALAGMVLMAARRGVPGAKGLAARLLKPTRAQVKAEMYGYREVNLS